MLIWGGVSVYMGRCQCLYGEGVSVYMERCQCLYGEVSVFIWRGVGVYMGRCQCLYGEGEMRLVSIEVTCMTCCL